MTNTILSRPFVHCVVRCSVLLLMAALLLGLALSHAQSTQAAGVVGTGTPQSCTESAFDMALAGGGVVTFNCGAAPQTIVLSSEKIISFTASVDGGGLITFSGGHTTRLFNVQAGGTLTLTNLTLTAGNAGASNGGAIAIGAAGTVALTNVTLSDNSAAAGAGIYNMSGSAMLLNVTLSGNAASGSGGGLFVGSGPVTMGTTQLINVTFSGNTAANGGGLHDFCTGVTLVNVTLRGNSASASGGGLSAASTCPTYPNRIGAVSSLSLRNSVVADSPAGGNCSAGSVPISSSGFNLSDDSTCVSYFNQPGDRNNSNAMLNSLANNGGPTQTHLPQPGSPLIDHGTNLGCPPADQRGVKRPQGQACDMGAVEVIELFLPLIRR